MGDMDREIQLAEDRLRELDPILGQIIIMQGPLRHAPRDDYFSALCQSIISQQVSTAAAAAIFLRLKETTNLRPASVNLLNPTQIKFIGLSRQKASYLIDLAEHFVSNPKIYNHLSQSSDMEVIAELTAVKGIGVWTAQMFLMFTLVRLDVFAPADLGLQKAMAQLYGLKKPPSLKKLVSLSRKWQPYRTVACWHLWRLLDAPCSAWE
jgi:DNA-3-methyladenine glycosylase II